MKEIGFTPLDENGEPYRPMLGRSWRARKKPTTVYQSQKSAQNYSPVGKSARVYIDIIEDMENELKLKENIEPIWTDDFHYDLFFRGTIEPSKLLDEESAKKVLDAVEVISKFQMKLEDEGMVEYN